MWKENAGEAKANPAFHVIVIYISIDYSHSMVAGGFDEIS